MTPITALTDDRTGGALTAPPDNDCPNYNVKLVLRYCRENGKEPQSLTEEELSHFIEPDRRRKIA